jgi:hypothetical protein
MGKTVEEARGDREHGDHHADPNQTTAYFSGSCRRLESSTMTVSVVSALTRAMM